MKGILFILGLLALAGLFSCKKIKQNKMYSYRCTLYNIVNGDTLSEFGLSYNNTNVPPNVTADSLQALSPTAKVNCK
jgi:hypothetical protein